VVKFTQKIKNITHISIKGNAFEITPEQSAQIKQLMLDWISQKVFIENDKLSVNFDIS
jgi:hypothetical protein